MYLMFENQLQPRFPAGEIDGAARASARLKPPFRRESNIDAALLHVAKRGLDRACLFLVPLSSLQSYQIAPFSDRDVILEVSIGQGLLNSVAVLRRLSCVRAVVRPTRMIPHPCHEVDIFPCPVVGISTLVHASHVVSGGAIACTQRFANFSYY
jgi:hypothetical protein